MRLSWLMRCSGVLFLGFASVAVAAPTDNSFEGTQPMGYVTAFDASAAGKLTNFVNWAPFLRVHVRDAAGNTVDLCSSMSGTQTYAYVHPDSNNKDVIERLLQAAMLAGYKVTLWTKRETQNGLTECFVKSVRIDR